MRLHTIAIAFFLLASTLVAASAPAQDIVYMTAGGNPWGVSSNPDNLNAAFGAGAWIQKNYCCAPVSDVFKPSVRFVYMEGGANHDLAMNSYLSSNRAAIEAWVTAGGRLFLNSAGWNTGMNYGFGGVTLSYFVGSANAIAVSMAHPIYAGPKTPTQATYVGNWAAHDTVSGAGITAIIRGESGASILAEKFHGAGHVLFGGLTAPYFWSPASAHNLWQNIFLYIAGAPVTNRPPAPSISAPLSSPEGSTITATASVSDPDSNETFTYAWSVTKNGSPYASGNGGSITFTPDDNASYVVSLTVTDHAGATGSDSETIAVTNVNPAASLTGAPTSSPEGTAISLGSTFSDPGVADTFTHAWAVTKNGTPYASGSGTSMTFTPDDNGTYVAKLVVTDDDGGSDTETASISVTNLAPTIALVGPTGPLALSSVATVTASYGDAGSADTHTATFQWDDGTSSVISCTAGLCTASRTYLTAGVYAVTVTLQDDDGGSAGSRFEYVVIFDPAAGFVTGGGWITSPEGAYTVAPLLTGKASFGFVSKYQKGQSTPAGETEFQFHVANFYFRSSSYEWLVIAGAKAQYKGKGTVNGTGDYGFLLTATDGAVNGGGGIDRFRIKIWDRPTGNVVYDNVAGVSDDLDSASPQQLGGGSIVIHAKK